MLKRILVVALVAVLTPISFAEEAAKPGDVIAWEKDLPAAFAKAKAQQKPLMVCVNARLVAGRSKEEPAAKGLREIIYKDPRVVTRSREFVCAFLDRSGSSADFGELRALGIQGVIVSPQHIFVHPDGEQLLTRQEYWSHGSGESGVKALLALMAQATTKLTGPVESDGEGEGPDIPEEQPEVVEAPPAADPAAAAEELAKQRADWITKQLGRVVNGSPEERQQVLRSLVKHDENGDCTTPLIEMLKTEKKNTPVLVDVVRALGVPGLDAAAAVIDKLLKHKEELVRGNAAVTLEYIGCAKSAKALRKYVDKEDNESIANHMYRALGRCGAGDAKSRALLLKKSMAGKSTFATYGPIIGLAYFENDKKAARGVEKEFKKVGHPLGGRRGWRNSFKRAIYMWTLTEIRDPKSGPWIRKERMEPLENAESDQKERILKYYDACARKCETAPDEVPEDAQADVIEGIRRYIGFRRDRTPLQDEYRKDRDTSKFQPKMEYEALTDD